MCCTAFSKENMFFEREIILVCSQYLILWFIVSFSINILWGYQYGFKKLLQQNKAEDREY